jgi:diguanylate cyclase (GGDEF)-like protein
MELLLWRWSTVAQIVSALLLAIFFIVLRLSVRRAELRLWIAAWMVNLAALSVTVIFWFAQPHSTASFLFIRFLYVFSKTTFVVLLVTGAASFGCLTIVRWRSRLLAWIAAFSALAALSVWSLNGLGTIESFTMMALFGVSAALLLASGKSSATRWLAFGFILRAVLAGTEGVAHWSQLFPNAWSETDRTKIFLAAYSSFDAAAEWVIALGCVLMLYSRIQDELTEANTDLVNAQEVLRMMADRDPMTGLANRRALPAIFRDIYSTGATLLFFDLNDFKQINDTHGHHAGDECLRRFAGGLQACFRPDDHIIRYAGDEFLVIAPAVSPEALEPGLERRLQNLRDRLANPADDVPPIQFSVGTAELAPGGDPEAAIKAADEAMYQDKAEKHAAGR